MGKKDGMMMAANITNHKSLLPTLRQIRRTHYISARDLADAAAIPLQTELLMETGGAVNSEDAIKVLHALSLMTGCCYTREQIGGLTFTAQELDGKLDPDVLDRRHPTLP